MWKDSPWSWVLSSLLNSGNEATATETHWVESGFDCNEVTKQFLCPQRPGGKKYERTSLECL